MNYLELERHGLCAVCMAVKLLPVCSWQGGKLSKAEILLLLLCEEVFIGQAPHLLFVAGTHQMPPLLQHQDSYALYGKNFHGCRWSILQFFGFRCHLRSMKMLSDKKHGQGKSSGGSKLRGSYVPLKSEDCDVTDNDTNVPVTKKHKASKRNSGKASLKTMILRKLYGKQGQKQKMLPVAPKLLRTISIHYLESNDYVTSDSNNSSASNLSLQNTTGSSLQRVTSNSLDGYGSRIGENHVKIIKKEVDEDKRSHHRISMDGVLHRVPYGRMVSEDVTKEKLFGSASATYDRESSKPDIGTAARMHANHQRSRSLTESLERYSQLLHSISSGESKRLLRSSKSTRDRSSEDPGATTITFQRINSSPEFRSKSLARHAQNVVIQEAVSSQMPEKNAMDGDVKIETCEVLELTKQDSCIVPLPFEEAGVPEKQIPSCDHDPIHACKVSESNEGASIVPLPNQDIGAKADLSCEPETESPMSVLYPRFSDDSASPVKYRILEDSKLKPRILHFVDPNVSANVHVLDADASTELSSTSPTCDNGHHNGLADFDALNVQEDQEKEAEFNYVKDIFEKSSFANEALIDDWYSKNITALQEQDCQHYEVGISECDFSDMSSDQLLLFDLTNEALLEMYKKYSAHKSKLSRFASCNRPKPVGRYILKDLWSQVSCHLNAQPQTSLEHDNVLAHDLAKSNGWVNFQRDADHLETELADFVLDKLLNELILQSVEF